MQSLAEVVRLLMGRREVTGAQLALDIGLSASSVSKIVKGRSKPRQITLTRLIKRLCITPEEEQLVIKAFSGLPDAMPDSPEKPIQPTPVDEIERVTRYLEIKAMAVAFISDVGAVVTQTGLSFVKDFRADPFICDFLITRGERRVAIDCKYNVNRDWDRTVTTISLLRKNLPCDIVLVTVPYLNDLCRMRLPEVESAGGLVVALVDLKTKLEALARS